VSGLANGSLFVSLDFESSAIMGSFLLLEHRTRQQPNLPD
jgi:hypothetical protein